MSMHRVHARRSEQAMGSCFSAPPSVPKETSGGGGIRMDVSSPSPSVPDATAARLRLFKYDELRVATGKFVQSSVIGEGGFGLVYKARLDDGAFVAVKKLRVQSTQGIREWQMELDLLGRLEHDNVVRLMGHCQEKQELMLVYEYMANGSLENHLFRTEGEPLSWRLRINIVVGAARGLAFLHAQQYIHRDYKTGNVLLDDKFQAKLSDFGMARSGPEAGKSHVTTRVIGTHGYAAPEYLATGHLYPKSDVYSFGVVLLELLTGRRTIERKLPIDQVDLVTWAQPYIARERDGRMIGIIMDRRLAGNYNLISAQGVAEIASRCLCLTLDDRPTMDEVLGRLVDIEALDC